MPVVVKVVDISKLPFGLLLGKREEKDKGRVKERAADFEVWTGRRAGWVTREL